MQREEEEVAEKGKVFISYARVDLPFVTRMAAEMRASGVDLWLDTLDIPLGASWDDAVERALKECSRFLVVLTPESVGSQNVRDEIAEAIERGVHIIPALLRPCEIPFRIKRLQRFDLSLSPEVEIKRLVEALGSGGQAKPLPASHQPQLQPLSQPDPQPLPQPQLSSDIRN